MNIGGYIRKLRNDKGYTLKELAKLTEISYSYLSQIETGNRGTSPEILKKLANPLDVSPTELMAVAGHIPQRTLLEEKQLELIQVQQELSSNSRSLNDLEHNFRSEKDPDGRAKIKKKLGLKTQRQMKLKETEDQLQKQIHDIEKELGFNLLDNETRKDLYELTQRRVTSQEVKTKWEKEEYLEDNHVKLEKTITESPELYFEDVLLNEDDRDLVYKLLKVLFENREKKYPTIGEIEKEFEESRDNSRLFLASLGIKKED